MQANILYLKKQKSVEKVIKRLIGFNGMLNFDYKIFDSWYCYLIKIYTYL